MAASETEEETEEHPDTTPNPILLKKSSSRDYSRVMCETLTYNAAEDHSSSKLSNNTGAGKIERQGSMRGNGSTGNTSNRYVTSKRSYFSHHLLGCFPSRSRRSSLTLIPKLVLADHTASGVAEMIGAGSGLRCGSSKGGPAFSRVPADSARGSYSEPTSPQVTCIGQVKAARSKTAGGSSKKKALKGSKNLLPPNPGAGSKSNPVLIRSRSSTKRASVSSPLSGTSPARFARSNSRRRDGEDDVLARVSEEFRSRECSYEIDLTRSEHGRGESEENVTPGVENGDESEENVAPGGSGVENGDEPEENVAPGVENGDESRVRSTSEVENAQAGKETVENPSSGVENARERRDGSRSTLNPGAEMLNPDDESTDQEEGEEEVEPSRESVEAATIAQHRQLAIQVCQALAAAVTSDHPLCSAPLTPPEDEHRFHPDHQHHQTDQQPPPAPQPRHISARKAPTLKRLDSLNDSSPRACLWMRRSIGRPIALDLSRKSRPRT